MTAPPFAALAAAALGAVGGYVGTRRGLSQLGHEPPRRPAFWMAALLSGSVGGWVAALVAWQTGGWWPLPGVGVWAVALTSAGCCDALTHRVPTPLVRQGAVLTTALLLPAAFATEQWTRWLTALATSAAAGGLFLLGARFAGIGRGDVRLAVLGGLGLGWAGLAGVGVGLAALISLTLVQALVTLARGGDRHTHIPYGPAMVVGFLLAVTAGPTLNG